MQAKWIAITGQASAKAPAKDGGLPDRRLSDYLALPVSEFGHPGGAGRDCALFVAGFSVVFTALGASLAFVGSLLLANVPLIVRVEGLE